MIDYSALDLEKIKGQKMRDFASKSAILLD
jgi:hypothetical protein